MENKTPTPAHEATNPAPVPSGAPAPDAPQVQPPQPEPPEPALFQSDAVFSHVDDSWPACLSNPASGFWDNLTFI